MNDRQLKEFCYDAALLMLYHLNDSNTVFWLEILKRFIESKDGFFDGRPCYLTNLHYSLLEKHPKSSFDAGEEFKEIVSRDLYEFIKEDEKNE